MKFIVSSLELLNHLQAISRVISNKSTLPILDNFLFDLQGQRLTLTASDLEVTMITSLDIESADGEGLIAMPSRLLLETLKKFPEQPLSFEIDMEKFSIAIVTEKGKFSIVGQNGEDFPELPGVEEDKVSSLQVPVELLETGINKTLFATADDELRPVMNGILLEISRERVNFVASDSHKLVRYQRLDAHAEIDEASFILPKKPAGSLRSILPKEEGDVTIEFDDKNAIFTLHNYKLICRLVEGNYPTYSAVIPQDNPNKVIIDRSEFSNTLGRVSLFSNQANNLIKLKLENNKMTVSAQDLDFSISAFEHINCQYNGDEMEIGFKSAFLGEILDNLSSEQVILEMSDPSRAGILLPFEKNENEDELMLLMPMMINA
jgi:DNA polymerase-3 subunit beta